MMSRGQRIAVPHGDSDIRADRTKRERLFLHLLRRSQFHDDEMVYPEVLPHQKAIVVSYLKETHHNRAGFERAHAKTLFTLFSSCR